MTEKSLLLPVLIGFLSAVVLTITGRGKPAFDENLASLISVGALWGWFIHQSGLMIVVGIALTIAGWKLFDRLAGLRRQLPSGVYTAKIIVVTDKIIKAEVREGPYKDKKIQALRSAELKSRYRGPIKVGRQIIVSGIQPNKEAQAWRIK